jgi:hypothetical protein
MASDRRAWYTRRSGDNNSKKNEKTISKMNMKRPIGKSLQKKKIESADKQHIGACDKSSDADSVTALVVQLQLVKDRRF